MMSEKNVVGLYRYNSNIIWNQETDIKSSAAGNNKELSLFCTRSLYAYSKLLDYNAIAKLPIML